MQTPATLGAQALGGLQTRIQRGSLREPWGPYSFQMLERLQTNMSSGKRNIILKIGGHVIEKKKTQNPTVACFADS